MRIKFFGHCPVCDCVMRGETEEKSECSNTACVGRAIGHGQNFRVKPIEGRLCSECNGILYEGVHCAFCANPDCVRYLREQ